MPDQTPPQYVVATVEAAILKLAAELHPQRLTAKELAGELITKPKDIREVDTAAEAIRNLREFGLLCEHDDETIELTKAALHAVTLLT